MIAPTGCWLEFCLYTVSLFALRPLLILRQTQAASTSSTVQKTHTHTTQGVVVNICQLGVVQKKGATLDPVVGETKEECPVFFWGEASEAWLFR